MMLRICNNLKSSMDRFIGLDNCQKARQAVYLKSSMDRFIEPIIMS